MKLLIVFVFSFFSFIRAVEISSGGELSSDQRGIDVEHYDIRLKVDTKRKMISGYTDIKIKVLDNIRFYEFDLIKDYFVSKVTVDSVSLPFKHKKNKILIKAKNIKTNSVTNVRIFYKGKPPVAKRPPWEGGFTWGKSKDGYPWVGVSCQGEGSQIWFPSKEHPSDEPDSVDMFIMVPKPLTVASNGILQNIKDHNNKWHTWHWKTKYNINPYNINFTIGHFDLIERIFPVLNKPLLVQYYVLKENTEAAQGLLDQAEDFLDFYTRNFGQYPWIKEKFGLVETPYLGMEHQTINAYGNNYKYNKKGYDWLMLHEMAHEWWGNYLSVSDWADLWIHEGFAVYAEAMYIEEKFGRNEYHKFFRKKMSKKIPHKFPVVTHRNATMSDIYGLDVYNKGAYVLHMLRFLIGDEVFFKTLREFLHIKKDLKNNQVTTQDFINLVNKNTKEDLNWFFKVYLYEKDYPVLIQNTTHGSNHTFVELFWKNKNFFMPVDVVYNSNVGIRKRKLSLSNSPLVIAIPQYNKVKFDPEKRLLFEVSKTE